MTNQDRLIKILDAAFELVSPVLHPELVPKLGVTHCNLAVNIVAQRAGFDGFKGLLANAIVDRMWQSDFEVVAIQDSQARANNGDLVVAGAKGQVHGHVCIIRPGISKPSGHWGINAPMVLNIGGENFNHMGLNHAFQQIPGIWAWRG